MEDDKARIRRLTLFFTSLFCAALTVVLAFRGYQLDAPHVVLGNLTGAGLALWSAWSVRKPTRSPWPTYAIGFFLLAFIVALVVSGYQNSVTVIWLLAVPPIAILVLGTRAGMLVSLAFAPFFAWVLLGSSLIDEAALATEFRYRLPVVYVLITFVVTVYAWASDYFHDRLQQAAARINQLEQIVPICASCKKVRSGEAWEDIDVYLRDHQDQQVSHGLCPTCSAAILAEDRALPVTQDG